MYEFVNSKESVKVGDKVTLVNKGTGEASFTGRTVRYVSHYDEGGFDFITEPGLAKSVSNVNNRFHILVEKSPEPENWPPQIDDVWKTENGTYWHYLDGHLVRNSLYMGAVSVTASDFLDRNSVNAKLVFRKD